jgi:hypothetical protein
MPPCIDSFLLYKYKMVSAYNTYIGFIVFIKIAFVCLAVTHLYLKLKRRTDSELDKKIIYYKEKAEFIFVALMSGLLIFLFNPRPHDRSKFLTKETRFILYLFGFVLLITAKWETFIDESVYFKRLQHVV